MIRRMRALAERAALDSRTSQASSEKLLETVKELERKLDEHERGSQ